MPSGPRSRPPISGPRRAERVDGRAEADGADEEVGPRQPGKDGLAREDFERGRGGADHREEHHPTEVDLH